MLALLAHFAVTVKVSALPSVRPFVRDEWQTYRALRLRSLIDSPGSFGSTLEHEQRKSDRHWSERLGSGTVSDLDCPLIAEAASAPVGLAWGRIHASDPHTAYVYQMWVDPGSRDLGLGRMLLEALVAWATAASAREVRLGVTVGNDAATRLYTRAGFLPVGQPEPLRPGSHLRSQSMRLDLGARRSID